MSGFDSSQFKAFSDNFSKKANTAQKFKMDLTKKIAKNALGDYQANTPVGQYTNLTFYVTANKKLVAFEDKKNARTGGELRRAWEVAGYRFSGNDMYIRFVNSKEYASYVNSGHRSLGKKTNWVEGRFFVEKTEEGLQVKVPEYAQKLFDDFLKGLVSE